jgi:hypothetical protein
MIEIIGGISVDFVVISQLLIMYFFYQILEENEIITVTQNIVYFQILRKSVIYLEKYHKIF